MSGLVDNVAQAGLLERLAEGWRSELARDGGLDLWQLLHRLLPSYTDEELFLLAGELMAWMLEQGEPLPPAGWHWRPLGHRLELHDLLVHRTGTGCDGR